LLCILPKAVAQFTSVTANGIEVENQSSVDRCQPDLDFRCLASMKKKSVKISLEIQFTFVA
jgi:hypothetical protein